MFSEEAALIASYDNPPGQDHLWIYPYKELRQHVVSSLQLQLKSSIAHMFRIVNSSMMLIELQISRYFKDLATLRAADGV
jgi:hypothetical protein